MALIVCGNNSKNNNDIIDINNIDLFSQNQRIITSNILNKSLLK
jgi:hypothetical protein